MELNFNAMRWCWNNGVKIFPHPLMSDGSILKIVVSKNGDETIGTKKYNEKEVYKKIDELYTVFYKKNNESTK